MNNEALYKVLCAIEKHLRRDANVSAPQSALVAVSINGEIPQKLVSKNDFRTALWICNAGDKDLYLAPYEGDVGPGLYSLPIVPNDTLIMNADDYSELYKQVIFGFWAQGASDTCKAMITEFYTR